MDELNTMRGPYGTTPFPSDHCTVLGFHSNTVPRLDARRCARSIPDSYAGKLVVDTGGASGERGFVVLTLLPHRASTRSIPHVPAYKEGLPVVSCGEKAARALTRVRLEA